MNSWQKKFNRQLLKSLLPQKIVTAKYPKNVEKKETKNSPEPGEKFSHRVNCTLSKKEYDQLQKISKSWKSCPTKLLKKLAFSHLEKRKIFSPEGEKILRGLVIEIRRIGTNINQIAKQANTVQKIGFSDLRKAHKKISELEKILLKAIVFYSK